MIIACGEPIGVWCMPHKLYLTGTFLLLRHTKCFMRICHTGTSQFIHLSAIDRIHMWWWFSVGGVRLQLLPVEQAVVAIAPCLRSCALRRASRSVWCRCFVSIQAGMAISMQVGPRHQLRKCKCKNAEKWMCKNCNWIWNLLFAFVRLRRNCNYRTRLQFRKSIRLFLKHGYAVTLLSELRNLFRQLPFVRWKPANQKHVTLILKTFVTSKNYSSFPKEYSFVVKL